VGSRTAGSSAGSAVPCYEWSVTETSPRTPFHDLDAYLALPRVGGLTLSPDGTRLITTVSTLNPERTGYVTALWEVDPTGRRPARRLTRSAKGEGGAAFLPDGSLLFASARPDPDAAAEEEAVPALWLLPADGGEARVLATRPGGVSGVVAARSADRFVLTSRTLPAADSAEEDEKRRKARKERKVTAILHEQYPVRFWDHELGPDAERLLTGVPVGEPAPGADRERLATLVDLTPRPGRSLDEAGYDLSPDGSTVLTTWLIPDAGGGRHAALALVDTGTGERRILVDDPEADFDTDVAFSPDGGTAAAVRVRLPAAGNPPDVDLVLVDVASGAVRVLAADWDLWPGGPCWTPDGSALIVTADLDGTAPLFRVDVATGGVTRLTGDHGSYGSPQPSPDGTTVYALRSAIDAAPAPVRLDARAADQRPIPLSGPVSAPDLPGTLTEVRATAEDGTPLRSWLVLPDVGDSGSPAPLLLWIHGGPLGSWNTWSWRWNPWLMAAQGYAVLLPDPALSTGYGLDFIARGWGRWGFEPYTDLMALTDTAVARPDIDAARTAAMGGSFGGYMANWVAGHTNRFRGIVSHASLWALDQFGPTTDAYDYWRREMSAEMVAVNSPHTFVADIRTPMLLIHGDRDYRVPIGETVRLWAELAEHHAVADGSMPHKFLYFPDENHWVLAPQNAKVWYATVLAFLDMTVHDKPWQIPDILT
jgi:dipeptidyl aminopeptidase/acylaminoacyl peptidase